MKRKVTVSLDSGVYSKYQQYCEENAILLSKRIEILMKNEMNGGKKKG